MTETTPRNRGNLPFIAIVVVLVAALAVEGFILVYPERSRGAGDLRPVRQAQGRPVRQAQGRPAEALQAIASSSNKIETFGAKSAPIKIEFYAPLALEWHQKTISLLRDYDRKHPGAIFVTLMPMGNSECDQAIQRRGVTCAAIFINGKNEFTLPDGRKAELYQRPNQSTSTYRSEDVITILSHGLRP